jgi:predicted pore-forming effector associated with SMODS systems
MQPHEYSVIGLDRTSIGRYLSTAAGLMASVTAILITLGFDLAKRLGLSDDGSSLAVFPINATAFYFLGHLAFNKWIWRHKFVQAILGVPDLDGEWDCQGRTKDNDGTVTYEWNATVTITQTWEKIRVYLNTGQSSSRSKSASLVKEPGRGYVLMYSYQNEPRIGEPELRAHVGYCELQLSEDLKVAEGDYFNNKGRITFGRMKLVRKEKKSG